MDEDRLYVWPEVAAEAAAKLDAWIAELTRRSEDTLTTIKPRTLRFAQMWRDFTDADAQLSKDERVLAWRCVAAEMAIQWATHRCHKNHDDMLAQAIGWRAYDIGKEICRKYFGVEDGEGLQSSRSQIGAYAKVVGCLMHAELNGSDAHYPPISEPSRMPLPVAPSESSESNVVRLARV
jgi:hypothetical protein